MSDPISIQVHQGREAFTSLASDWQKLLDFLTYPRVFASSAWFDAWLDVYSPSQISVITAVRGGEVVGLLPVVRLRTDSRGLFFTRISPPAPGITDYQVPCVRPDLAAEVLPLLWDEQLRRFPGATHWWPNFPVDDPAFPILVEYLRSRGMHCTEESESAPFLAFAVDSYADLEQNWTSSHRKDVRRQKKRLEEIGPVSIWQPASVEEARPVLEEFFRVHDEKWIEQGFPGIFSDFQTRKFFHAILSRLFGRGLHFSTLRCGDQDISYHFGFHSGGWMQWYRPSYRREFHVYSPSKVHIGMLMEQGFQAGWRGFDFLLGEEGYKLQWAPSRRRVVSIHAASSSLLPSYFWFSTGKPWLRNRAAPALMRYKGQWRRWLQSFDKGSAKTDSTSPPPSAP